MTTAIKDRLATLTKVLYAVSDFSFSFTDTTMSILWVIFMTDVVGLRPRQCRVGCLDRSYLGCSR